MQKKTLIIILFFSFSLNYSQDKIDNLVFEIISKVSKDNLEKDIISLANFGTRHTLSDTISKYRGIGAPIPLYFDIVSLKVCLVPKFARLIISFSKLSLETFEMISKTRLSILS